MQFIDSQYVKIQKTLLFVLLNSLEDMTQERPSSPQRVRVPISTVLLLILLCVIIIPADFMLLVNVVSVCVCVLCCWQVACIR